MVDYRKEDTWRFYGLGGSGGSYIIFTNGLNDRWSVASHCAAFARHIFIIIVTNASGFFARVDTGGIVCHVPSTRNGSRAFAARRDRLSKQQQQQK
jgi:hypothetical protein